MDRPKSKFTIYWISGSKLEINLYRTEIDVFFTDLKTHGFAWLDLGFEEKLYVNRRNVERIFIKPEMEKAYDWVKHESQTQEFWQKQDINKLKKE